jgi:hypothetical protein
MSLLGSDAATMPLEAVHYTIVMLHTLYPLLPWRAGDQALRNRCDAVYIFGWVTLVYANWVRPGVGRGRGPSPLPLWRVYHQRVRKARL